MNAQVVAGSGVKGTSGWWARSHLSSKHDTIVETFAGRFFLVLLSFKVQGNFLQGSEWQDIQMFCKELAPGLQSGYVCPSMHLPYLKDSKNHNDSQSYTLLLARNVKATWTLVPVAIGEDGFAAFYLLNTPP